MSNQLVINNKEVVNSVRERVVSLLDKRGQFSGTMTQLGSALRGVNRVGAKVVPQSPSVLRKVLNRAVYGLRREGVKVEFTRETDSFRKRVVSLEVR